MASRRRLAVSVPLTQKGRKVTTTPRLVKALVTGSAGFIGSHLVDFLIKTTDWHIIGLDSFRHGGDAARVSAFSLSSPRYEIVTCDLATPISRTLKRQIGPVDLIFNLASYSSVDYSLVNPGTVVRNNIDVALSMLEFAREILPTVFLQMSTDEVYGPALPGERFPEWSMIRPSNPYSASKAAQEAIAFSYWRSFHVPLLLVNATNVIGERQDVSKFVPLAVSRILRGEEVSVHCVGDTPGARIYIDVTDCASALTFLASRFLADPSQLLDHALPERYNVVGVKDVDNLQVVQRVAAILGKPLRYRLVDVARVATTLRSGHDIRYGLDGAKLSGLGWRPAVTFDDSLERSVRWFARHPEWL